MPARTVISSEEGKVCNPTPLQDDQPNHASATTVPSRYPPNTLPTGSNHPAWPCGQPVLALDAKNSRPKSISSQMLPPMASEYTSAIAYGRVGWNATWIDAAARQNANVCNRWLALASQSIRMQNVPAQPWSRSRRSRSRSFSTMRSRKPAPAPSTNTATPCKASPRPHPSAG